MAQNFTVVKRTGLTLQTVDGAANIIGTFPILPSKAYTFDVVALALRDLLTEAAGYRITATFRSSAAGVVTQVGATTAVATHEDDATWGVAFTVVGTNVNVVVTGNPGKIINWRADTEVQIVGFESEKT